VSSFQRDEKPKVIGYFDTRKSLAYDEFVDAAIDFQPSVSFYAIYNRQLAKALGLKTIGEIHFYEVCRSVSFEPYIFLTFFVRIS